MPYRRHSQLQSAHDLIRRLSAISAELAACLDSVVAELHIGQRSYPDAYLLRCAQNLASTQVAITQQIILLTSVIEKGGAAFVAPQPIFPSLVDQFSAGVEGHFNVQSETPIRLLEAPAAFQQAVSQTPGVAYRNLSDPKINPEDNSLRRTALIYAAPKESALGLTTSYARKLAKIIPRLLAPRYVIGVLLVMGLWIAMRPEKPIAPPKHEKTAALERKLDSRVPTEKIAHARSETPDAAQGTLTHDDATVTPLGLENPHPTIVISPPRPVTSTAALVPEPPASIARTIDDVAIDSDQPIPEPRAPQVTQNSVPKVIAKATNTPDAKPAAKEAQRLLKASTDVKPTTFKTTVKTEPAQVPKFAPSILALRDGKAALQIYQDLQKRHPSVLGNKSAELRNFTGSDQTPWVQLLAVPSSSKEEAEAICVRLGPEAKALGCKVVPY